MGQSGTEALKSFQTFQINDVLLTKVVEAVKAGEKEARTTGDVQSFEVFYRGYRQNICIGKVYILPAKIADKLEGFPVALLYGTLVKIMGGEELSDMISNKIGDSEFDEYSQQDMASIKDRLFKVDGKFESLVLFAPSWTNHREYVSFHFTKDDAKLRLSLRQLVFGAYYDPRLSSAFDAMVTDVSTDKVDVTDITPKLPYPDLKANPLTAAFPVLNKAAAQQKKSYLTIKNADALTKEMLEPEEVDVIEALDIAVEHAMGVKSPEEAGEENHSEGKHYVPRIASGKTAEEKTIDLGDKGSFKVEEGGLHKALGIPEDEKIPESKLRAVMNGDYPEHVKNMARSAIGLKHMHHGSVMKVAYVAHVPGHTNSKGESAPWVIKQHNTGKILESFKSEEAAKEGLKNMESHKHGSANWRIQENEDNIDGLLSGEARGGLSSDLRIDGDTVSRRTPQFEEDEHLGSKQACAEHEVPSGVSNVGPGTVAHDAKKNPAVSEKEFAAEAAKTHAAEMMPNGIELNPDGTPKRKAASVKTAGQIRLANKTQVWLFKCELEGQMSDGMWENSSPMNHWKELTNSEVVVGEPGVTNVHPRRTYGYRRLVEYVGDRMLATGKLSKAYPELPVNQSYAYAAQAILEAKPGKTSSKKTAAIVEKTVLLNDRDGADKEYWVLINDDGKGLYTVDYKNGKRGKVTDATRGGTKSTRPVSLDQAKRMAQVIIDQKIKEGYRDANEGKLPDEPMQDFTVPEYELKYVEELELATGDDRMEIRKKLMTAPYNKGDLMRDLRQIEVVINGAYKSHYGSKIAAGLGTGGDQHMQYKGHDMTLRVWDERDRLNINLADECCDKEILDVWDDDARSLFEDGFFNAKNLIQSVIEYAESAGLMTDIADKGNEYEEHNIIESSSHWKGSSLVRTDARSARSRQIAAKHEAKLAKMRPKFAADVLDADDVLGEVFMDMGQPPLIDLPDQKQAPSQPESKAPAMPESAKSEKPEEEKAVSSEEAHEAEPKSEEKE